MFKRGFLDSFTSATPANSKILKSVIFVFKKNDKIFYAPNKIRSLSLKKNKVKSLLALPNMILGIAQVWQMMLSFLSLIQTASKSEIRVFRRGVFSSPYVQWRPSIWLQTWRPTYRSSLFRVHWSFCTLFLTRAT